MAEYMVTAKRKSNSQEEFTHWVMARDRNAAIGLAVFEMNKERQNKNLPPLMRSKLKFSAIKV